jgi:HK97 family phage portal protein
MKSLVRTVGSALGSIANRAPVAYTSDRGGLAGFIRKATGPAEAHLAAMGSVGTLFNVVSTTSTATSSVSWHLHRRTRRAPGVLDSRTCEACDKPGYTLVEDHPALLLWNKPNDFWLGQEWREAGQQHLDLVGESWTVVERNPGLRSIPLGLWPVRPDRITPVPSQEKFLAGYIYTNPSGEQVPLELDEVLSIKLPNPIDSYRGMGPVQSIMVDLDSTRYSAEWNRRFFLNDATPGGVVEIPVGLGDTQFKQMLARWRETHRGVSNAHRVGFLENGAKWVDRKYTQRDMQFSELRSVSREVIREAYGFPAFAAGIIDDVNRATAEAAMTWFARQLTVPRLDRWKAMANGRFLPLFGPDTRGLEFEYDNPVPEDREADNAERESKANAYAKLVGAGVHPDDAAAECGLPQMRTLPRPVLAPAATGAPESEPETVGAAA